MLVAQEMFAQPSQVVVWSDWDPVVTDGLTPQPLEETDRKRLE
jgi:hypothetical protein